MARTYKRDARGRFAGSGGSSRGTSGPGSKPRGSVTAKGRGTAAARNRLVKSQQKLAANATPAQRGAVTRAKNKLQTAKANNTSKLNIKPSTKGGVMKGRVARNPGAGAKLAARGKVSPQSNRLAKAQANVERLKNQSPKPGTRRLDSQQIRRQLKADRAVEIYNASPDKRKQIIRNTPPARTERAKQNWMQTRDARLQNAKLAGLPLVTVGGKPGAKAKPPAGSYANQKIEQAKGRTKVLTESKSLLNKQLKELNAKIKDAGPNAGGLRLEKIKIKDRLSQVQIDLKQSKAASAPAAKPKATAKPLKQTLKLTRQTPGSIKGTVKRNPQAGAKLAAAGRVKVNREPKTKAQILSQTRRIVEKASARKEKSLLSHVRVKNDRRIAKATAVRQAIINPPKPKPKKRDANRLTPTQIVNRRMLASQDAWNRGMRGY